VTKNWLSWSHAWCHGACSSAASLSRLLLRFQKAGELTIVDDELDDISAIVEIIEDIKERGLLAGVAVDPAGLGEFTDALAAIGITVESKLLIGAPQGYAMMNAIKTQSESWPTGRSGTRSRH
jgi:phage terminase large subunit-like protein